MNLDKTKFLLLAASMSSGCILNITDGETDGETASADSATDADGGTESTNGDGDGTSDGGDGDGDGSTGDGDGDGSTGDGDGDGSTGDGDGDGSTGDGDGDGECDDSQGTMTCDELPTDCEVWQAGICDDNILLYKPGVADAFISCMVDSECGVSDPLMDAYGCTEEAAMGACPDASADSWCDDIVSVCTTADYTECQNWLSGMTDAGRQAMSDCMTPDNFCDFGFYTCSEGL
jgi:hypothetical protein